MVPHLKQLFGKPGFKERPRPIYFRDVQRYPPSTKGFFYFDRPSPLPHPAAGSLRFRIVPEANPALFASGHDLVDVQTGIAWEKHLVHLKMNKSDRHLYDAILQEGLLTPDEDRRITEMHPKGILNLYRGTRSQVLNSILDPFLVNFSVTSFRLTIIDPDRIYQINKSHRWANNIKGPTRSPYSGSCSTRSIHTNLEIELTVGQESDCANLFCLTKETAKCVLVFALSNTWSLPSQRPS